MSLTALLGDIEPGWFRPAADSGGLAADTSDIDPALLRRAIGSPIGQRMLARWLLDQGEAEHILAPQADGSLSRAAQRWPQAPLTALMRDLGVLAHAPAIRGEVRREPVRTLKRILANSYMLALDTAVWDGAVDADIAAQLRSNLQSAFDDPDTEQALEALFHRQGRNELLAWAAKREPALGDWIRLQSQRCDAGNAHLPEKQVLFLHAHHEARARAH